MIYWVDIRSSNTPFSAMKPLAPLCHIFLGDVGLMEHREPLASLVVRVKQLLAVRPTHQPSST